MNKTILAIGAHVGDMELTVGALLASCAVFGRPCRHPGADGRVKKARPPGRTSPPTGRNKIAQAQAFMRRSGRRGHRARITPTVFCPTTTPRALRCAISSAVSSRILSSPTMPAACTRIIWPAIAIVTDAWFYAAIAGFERELPPPFCPHVCTMPKTGRTHEDFKPYVYHGRIRRASPCGKRPSITTAFTVHGTSFPYKEYYSHLKRLRGIEGRRQYCECFMIPPEQVKLVKNTGGYVTHGGFEEHPHRAAQPRNDAH